jgi:hypothetical protein
MGLSSAATVGTSIEKLAKRFYDMASSHSTVAEDWPHHPKIAG